jgi:hypothetical protein
MADNWSYVILAYGVATLALLGYWRRLRGKARTLSGRRKDGGGR